MATAKQKAAARRNIKKAAAAARKKRTIAHLSKRTRTALGKQGAKIAKQKRRSRRGPPKMVCGFAILLDRPGACYEENEDIWELR